MFPPASERVAELSDELELSVELSRMQGQTIEPAAVIRVLDDAQVKYVLVGAHAISALAGDPRATMDVDVIASDPVKARDALSKAFPQLTVEEHPVVIRFKQQGQEVIDIIRPTAAPIFNAALTHTTRVKLGKLDVTVPLAEAALALKFASMISLTRASEDRHIDAHDFIRLAKHNAKMDRQKLAELGEIVYVGGGNELLKLVDDAQAGRQVSI